MVTPEEQALIADRMAEAGISNMGAYMRKMALNGYVLHTPLLPNIIMEGWTVKALHIEFDQ